MLEKRCFHTASVITGQLYDLDSKSNSFCPLPSRLLRGTFEEQYADVVAWPEGLTNIAGKLDHFCQRQGLPHSLPHQAKVTECYRFRWVRHLWIGTNFVLYQISGRVRSPSKF